MSIIHDTSPVLYLFLFAVAGLISGSFMTVVVTRLPAVIIDDHYDEWWLFAPASFCDHCGKKLTWYENIPLISWLMAEGKCRHCGEAISIMYPAIEAGTALIFVMSAYYFDPVTALALAWIGWFLLALAIIDYRSFLLPDCLTLFLLWSGLIFTSWQSPALLGDAVAGAVTGYAIFYTLNRVWLLLRKSTGLGLGDAKLLAALGAWTGWLPLARICFLAACVGIAFYIWRKMQGHTITHIPFGMPLALAGGYVILGEYYNLH